MEQYSVKAVLSAVDKNFTSTMSKANNSLNGVSKASQSALGSITKIASGIGVFKAVSAAADLIKGSIASAFGRQDTMEQFNRTMKTLTGSADAATGALDKLRGITKGTAYGLDIAAKSTQDFVTRGMNIEKATDSVAAWADAVAFYGRGTNEQLQSVTDAIAKMRTKGKVEMDQLNQLFDVGIDAVGTYAKAVGRDSASVQEDLSSGKLSAEKFLSTVEKAMMEGTNGVQNIAGAAKEAGASWQGTFDNMRAATTRGVLSIINSIDTMLEQNGFSSMRKSIKAFGDTAEQVLNNVGKYIENLSDAKGLLIQIGSLFSGLFVVSGGLDYINLIGGSFNNVTKKVSIFGDSLSNAKQKASILANVLNGKISMGSDSFKKIDISTQILSEKITGLKSIFKGTFDTGSESFNSMNSSSKKFLENVDKMNYKVKGISGTVKSVSSKFASLLPNTITNKVSSLQSMFSGVFNTAKEKTIGVGDAFTKMGFKFSAATGRFEKDAPKLWKMFDGISNKTGKIGSVISNGFSKSASVGVKTMTTMVKSLSSVFSMAMTVLGPAAILGLAVAGLGVVNQQFGNQISEMLKKAISQGPQIIAKFVGGITGNIPKLSKCGTSMIKEIVNTVSKLLPNVLQAGISILDAIIKGVTDNIDSLINSALTLISSFGNAILSAVPQLMTMGLSILLSLINGMLSNMDLILSTIEMLFTNLSNNITTYLPTMITMGCTILENLALGIVQALPSIIEGALSALTTFVDTISDNLPKILDSAIAIVSTLVDGIVNNLPQIISAGVNLIGSLLSAFISNFPKIVNSGFQIISKLVSGLIKAIPDVVSGIGKVAKKIITTFAETDWLAIGVNIIKGIAKGIGNAAGALWDAAKNVLGGFTDKVLGFFGIHSPSRWGVYVGKMVDFGVSNGLKKYTNKVSNMAQNIYDSVNDTFNSINGTFNFDYAFTDGISTLSYAVDIKDDELNRIGANYDLNTKYTINVPVIVDGKEIAHVTAPFTQEEIEKNEKLKNMIKGVK